MDPVLNLVRQEGVMVDAVSTGEIQRALAAGYAAHASREAAADGLPPVHPIVYRTRHDRKTLTKPGEAARQFEQDNPSFLVELGDVADVP